MGNLSEGEAAPKFVRDFGKELSRRVAGHFREFFAEMRLIVIMFVKVIFEQVERLPGGAFSVEPLKAKDSS